MKYEEAKLSYTLECYYNPDWKFICPGSQLGYFYVETKGVFDTNERRKMLNVKRCNPLEDIRLVFMQDNFLYKGSKVRYSEWAAIHGFKYHVVGKTSTFVPREWLQECSGFTVATEKLLTAKPTKERKKSETKVQT